MYQPDKFINTFKEESGQEIWEFLNMPENLVRMETASYLSRPAVEPLSPFLLQRFGPSVKRDRIKQMIGHMARQIMEARGYRLEGSNVRIKRLGNMFASGSRYGKAEV